MSPTHGEVGAGDGDSGLQPQGQVGQRRGRVEAELGPVQGQGVGLGQELLWRHTAKVASVTRAGTGHVTSVWGHNTAPTHVGTGHVTNTLRAPCPIPVPMPVPVPVPGRTSLWMLGTDAARPLWTPWELLGELGPDPGALLQTDDTAGHTSVTQGTHECDTVTVWDTRV